ncbi:cation diffusion facilitator family transporter [Paenibacillus sp. WQ 127069]|uniref:Cation diffusion facilitator family transporter n=1 Tax=Paenibacillus baimaensis TaxID=2982185 RepID=A0ABT2UC63_9BACL|nr:cation diffusion facilitator family transporter [Paenibacillus sp. WQ 127069]MCU6792211.1 cation diffusion facilitator family transporter [Paenibacillus sp. WQ 127069]
MSTLKSSAILALWISLISNLILTALKIVVGYVFNSQVLIADGIHNAGDVVATIAALTSSMVSKKPADDDHPYGHGKAEVISSAFVAIILAFAAIFMVYKSIEAILMPIAEASIITLIAAFISLLWKQGLYTYCIRLGREMNSKSLIATANDHLADVYASLAAVAGIGVALIGGYYNMSFGHYGDPVAGILVSYFVMRLAFKMGKESIGILMEANVTAEQLGQLENIVRSIPQVKRVDRIRARDHGHYMIVDIRVSVPNELTIQEGHDVSLLIKNAIKNEVQAVGEVLVHLNPWYEKK